jgi:hypothetical protein
MTEQRRRPASSARDGAGARRRGEERSRRRELELSRCIILPWVILAHAGQHAPRSRARTTSIAEHGVASLRWRLWAGALRVYVDDLALLAFAVTIVATLASATGAPACATCSRGKPCGSSGCGRAAGALGFRHMARCRCCATWAWAFCRCSAAR